MIDVSSAILPRAAGEGNRAQRGGGGFFIDPHLCSALAPVGDVDDRAQAPACQDAHDPTRGVGPLVRRSWRPSPSTALRAVPLPRQAGEDCDRGARSQLAGRRK